MSEQEPTRIRRSIEKRTARAERLGSLASNPSTPWLVSKFAALEARRERPSSLELRLADKVDAMDARSRQQSQESREGLIGALGELRRVRAGEPRKVPPSDEVFAFAHKQEVAELDRQTTQSPQALEGPEQQ